MALQVEIVTPSRIAWSGQADQVEAPGFNGEYGVLPEHAAMLTLGEAGVVTVHHGGEITRFQVGAGFAEVGPDRVTLLVDSCDEA